MFGWIVRGLLIVSGAITQWFVSRDAESFDVMQGVVATLLLALIVFVLAFWPAGWSAWLARLIRR